MVGIRKIAAILVSDVVGYSRLTGTDEDRILARLRTLRSDLAFSYKGRPIDARTIGHELNVRYVLEGSVQRSGRRTRVNVQLIDAETGSDPWAERFDKPVANLFDSTARTKSSRA